MKFGISNLRRLHNVGPIDLKPITILVGRNSGGKSTFLRSLPLIRQSIQTRTSSPILWFGDLVDFGTIEESISRSASGKYVAFTFEDEIIKEDGRELYYSSAGVYHYRQNSKISYGDVHYRVEISPAQDKNRISRIFIKLDHEINSIDLSVDGSGSVEKILVSGQELPPNVSIPKLSIALDDIFPLARFLRKNSSRENAQHWYGFPGEEVAPAIFSFLRALVDSRVHDKTLQTLAERMIINGMPSRHSILAAANSQGKIVKAKIAHILNQDGDEYKTLMMLLCVSNIPILLRDIGRHFKRILSSTLYIGPARAKSERYYRYQDLAVNEIDPDGKNFPIFLNSLSKEKQDSFSTWVKGLYGYSVSVSQRSGHISITLTDRDVDANIVDVGYGISQILPVLGQIWWAKERVNIRTSQSAIPILAIEQPELHLHPAHQAILAKAFVDTISISETSKRAAPVRFLIETHSETLINRLGRMIARGELSSDSIQIAIFEPSDSGNSTVVRTSEFNERGALIDWPYGFFQAD